MLEFSDIYGISVTKSKNNRYVESENHSHPYYELLYVRTGNFTYFIDDEIMIEEESKTYTIEKKKEELENLFVWGLKDFLGLYGLDLSIGYSLNQIIETLS